MTLNPETPTTLFPYIKTIHHSSNVVSVSPITLCQNYELIKGIVIAKTSSLEFYLLKKQNLTYSHTVELFYKISTMIVIPVKHKWADSIFIADTQNKFAIYRPTEAKGLDILFKRTCGFDFVGAESTPTINLGIQYNFNCNDTEGYFFYAMNNDIIITTFSEKIDGFHQISSHANKLPPNTSLITTVSKNKTRYKKQTLIVIYNESGHNQLGVFDLQLNPYPSNLKLKNLSTSILSIFGGSQFIVVDPFEISLYSYDFGNLITAYKQPLTNSINKIISLENVYCGIGDQLLIFNNKGVTKYGDYKSCNAVHIGGNKIISWHPYQNTKYVQLTQNGIQTIQQWVNLGPILQLNTVDVDGTQTYIINSHAKKNPISILSDALTFSNLVSMPFEGRIKSIFKLQLNQKYYLLVHFYYRPTLLFKIHQKLDDLKSGQKSNILEQIVIFQQQPLATYQNYIVTKKFIYTFSQQGLVQYLTFSQPVSKACFNSHGHLAIQINNERIQHFSINNLSSINEITIEKQLSVLLCSQKQSGMFWIGYCSWGSRKLCILQNNEILKIKLIRQAKAILKTKQYLFIGYSQGSIDVYSMNPYNKIQSFSSGKTPINKFIQYNESIMCFNDKSCIISASNPNYISKKNIALDNISGIIQLSKPNKDLFIISKDNKIQIITPNLSQKLMIKQLNISSSQKQQRICTIYPYLYVLSPFRIHRYNLKNFQQIQQFSIDLSSICCNVQKYLNSYILLSGKISVDYSIILWNNSQEISKLNIKKQVLTMKVIDEKYAVLGLQNQLKFIGFQNSNQANMTHINNKIQINDLFTVGTDIIPYAIDTLSQHYKIIIADSIRALILCSYNIEKRSLVVLSKFSIGSLGLEIAFLGNYILQSDISNNLYLLSGNLSSQNQLQRTTLSFNGGIHLNQSVWVMQKHIDSKTSRQVLIYGTSNGSIGKITLIPESNFSELKEFQKEMLLLSESVQFKASKNSQSPSFILLSLLNKQYENLKSNNNKKYIMSNNCLINGDIINTLIQSQQINQIITIANIIKDDEQSFNLKSIRNLIETLD